MRSSKIAVLVASLGLMAAAPAASSAASTDRAQAACKRATIAGKKKCIARGQYCSRSARAMRDYRRYGLSCTKRDSRGRYHLR